MKEEITVNEDMLRLISELNIDDKKEKPLISSKRPFGNSDYYRDVLRITGNFEKYTNQYGEISKEGKNYVETILEDVSVVLDILVQTQKLETGHYQKEKGEWNKVE